MQHADKSAVGLRLVTAAAVGALPAPLTGPPPVATVPWGELFKYPRSLAVCSLTGLTQTDNSGYLSDVHIGTYRCST